MTKVSDEVFESLIDDALDELPEEFAQRMRNVVVLARPYNEERPHLLGLFEGVPLPNQHANHTGFLPNAIFIYKEPLERYSRDLEELRREVRVTVLHEVGHYFGLEEEDLHRLGYS
ncbi:metallopeptidase family protein [Corynebacterium sp.]|uniref:metallopeptidase family protein n=1 Tax=Corynebacterium sp. TaxID=1720 RepID=UPI0037368058